MEKQIQQTTEFAKQIRKTQLETFANLGFGHIGGSLSITDLFAVLYGGEMKYDPKNPQWQDRDRFVVSKGHAGPALYSALSLVGFFPKEVLKTLNQGGTILPSHCDMNKTPGIDMTTGSLGQGTSTAEGMAVALKNKGSKSKVFCVIGDGESQEGQVWEAAMLGAQRKLDNFILFVDKNGRQLDGDTKNILNLDNIAERFATFGWETYEIDGNNIEALIETVQKAKSAENGKPKCVVLNTIKGKGVKFVEETFANHHMVVTKELAEQAIKELEV